MSADHWRPIVLPDLGAAQVQVVQWLVDVGSPVSTGDRLAELLADGVLFHLSAEEDGTLTQCMANRGSRVQAGETLGWIESPEGESSSRS